MALTPLKAGRGEGGALKRGNQGGRVTALTWRLQGAELGDRVVEGGQIRWWCGQAQAMWEEGDDRWGKGSLRRGRFPAMEAETGRGVGAARGPTGPGDEGGSPGRSGPAWRPGLAGLIFIGKNQKGFDFPI
jgi:hypothetical protein